MIDSSGKKIGSPQESEDGQFSLAEAKFLLNGLRNNFDEEKASQVLRILYRYLKGNGKAEDVIELITALEEFAPMTEDDEFLWKLFYIRKMVEEYIKNNDTELSQLDNHYDRIRLFDAICKKSPTDYNRLWRIGEYAECVRYICESKSSTVPKEELRDFLDLAEKEITELEQPEEFYWSMASLVAVAEAMYAVKVNDSFDTAAKFMRRYVFCEIEAHKYGEKIIKDFVDFSKKYISYISVSSFCYDEKEKEHLELMIKWLTKEIESGKSELEESLEKIKEIAESYN